MTRDIEKYAEDYLKDDFEYVLSYYRKQLLLSILIKYNANNIIDIGPAYNFLFNDYANFESYTIIEPSIVMCDKIKPKNNVRVVNDVFENVYKEFKDKNIDFIISSGLLHEIEDQDTYLNCIKEVCNKDTILHISVPNCESFHLVFAKEAGIIKEMGKLTDYSIQMQRCRTYNSKTLEEVITAHGFMVIEKGPFYLKLFNQSKMQQCIELGILTKDLLDALYKMVKYMPDLSAETWINARIL